LFNKNIAQSHVLKLVNNKLYSIYYLKKQMRTDLYDILEITSDASQQEIKEAMIKLSKKYATRGQIDHSARLRFNQIKEAYQVVSNPYRRASYDNFLQQYEEVKNNNKINTKLIKGNIKQQISNLSYVNKKIWIFITSASILILQFITKQLIAKWQSIKEISFITWKISKHKAWQIWRTSKLWFFITIRALQKIQAGEQLTFNGWRTLKVRDSSMYIRRTIITSEKIIYQAYPHWLFYLDLIGLGFFIICSYLLLNEPIFIQQNIPELLLWIPWLSTEYLKISVWNLGLGTLMFIGVMVIWEAFIDNKTTELVITSNRILHKTGLLSRTVIELKLIKFESITVKQSLAGRIFNYGTITITGMSRMQTTIPHIVAPLKFKKQLWQILEQEKIYNSKVPVEPILLKYENFGE